MPCWQIILLCTARTIPFRALLWIGQGWLALDEPVGGQVIADAHALLQARAATLPDDAARRMFLENVPEHRDLVALYAELSLEIAPVPPETVAAEPNLPAAHDVPVSPTPGAGGAPPVEPRPAPAPTVAPLTAAPRTAAAPVAAPQTVVSQTATPDTQTLSVQATEFADQIAALLGQLAQAQGVTVHFHGDIHIHQIVIHGQPKSEPDA
jgi:hypothetical protein